MRELYVFQTDILRTVYHDRASQIAAVLQHTAGKVLKTCKIDNTIGIWSTTIVY